MPSCWNRLPVKSALVVRSLRQQTLHRAGWKCRPCGTMSSLEVHHRELRNHLEARVNE
jgi:hypothetical protein